MPESRHRLARAEKLGLRYNTVRPFLSLLGEAEALDAAPAGRRIHARQPLGSSTQSTARLLLQVGHEKPVAGIEGVAAEQVGMALVPPAGGQVV